jgi:phospholipid N-methyltransferase|tara:strand:+ start:384 stop:947 length:564 start_codon:yes stop_codon:yes gene_type:complete
MKLLYLWFKNYINHPLEIGAIFPTSNITSKLMASELELNNDSIVVELGPGTGKITQAILNKGVLDKNLILVEINDQFSKALKNKFPKVKIFNEDAVTFLTKFEENNKRKIDIIISAIPLVSLDKKTNDLLCELAIKNLSSKGKFIQITYFIKCSFSKNIIKSLKLNKSLVGLSLINLPPAFVWKITK